MWSGLLEKHFDKLFLLLFFLISTAALAWIPMNAMAEQFIISGPIMGAIIMLITGNKKQPPEPPADATTTVTTPKE